MMKLPGYNVLVTGASQGFGFHVAEAFLAEGANVVFCARTPADVAAARERLAARLPAGQRVAGVPCDVSDAAEVARLFEEVARLGPLHAVVNNAGIHGPVGPTLEVPPGEWDRTWRINVTGTLLVSQHAIRAMRPQRAGKIINLSGGGATKPMPNFAAYAATKAAVVRLTETLAEEHRADGIDVNAIAPGAMRTRLTHRVVEAGPVQAGAEYAAMKKLWDAEPSGDSAAGTALCVFLASRASDGITGRLISARWDPWREPEKFRALAQGDVFTLRRIVPDDRPPLRAGS